MELVKLWSTEETYMIVMLIIYLTDDWSWRKPLVLSFHLYENNFDAFILLSFSLFFSFTFLILDDTYAHHNEH